MRALERLIGELSQTEVEEISANFTLPANWRENWQKVLRENPGLRPRIFRALTEGRGVSKLHMLDRRKGALWRGRYSPRARRGKHHP